ncbi:hypothetical protein [Pectobacterium parmentieri]|uniref:Uncharacterized protein n=1 Tax=Pectobacterium parmentieri TaxID=1905730 RepID=A0A8B3FDK5_PECPM|nr:hypothetical protein [Pectobacterium parmentieri]AOR61159.1 hypothetical protein A8F97_20055 [Pectobacterium parmentieri]AYH12174.1 hypothetical protein C5E24_22025 [Pectobacterium parmentieri]AYH20888.1 hypothetical protein C5E22_21905 [Pectobacterium parmentieri]AYH38451.1 hypothetical protein C5E17_21750 [Pectobacterium parmentieri]AZS58678.1 hypothetical protein C5E18_22435 [Pectobacterium parmentieri]
MIEYFNDSCIDEDKIICALGRHSYGDEDFSIFKCPSCNKIYLIDYEVDTIFPDSSNLLIMSNGTNFRCVCCNYDFQGKIIIGDKADKCFKASIDEVKESGWKWIFRK